MAFRGTHHCQPIPHDEIDVHAGIKSSAYRNCQVNPGHEKFISVLELTQDHLPPEHQTEDVMKWIQGQIDLTVKVRAVHISENRPDTFPRCDVKYSFCDFKGMIVPRNGTGFIRAVLNEGKSRKGTCQCPECKDEPKMEYWAFLVVTASHVLYDRSEAETAVFEVFYNSEEREDVKNLYGVDVWSEEYARYETDQCDVDCVTHDSELAASLIKIHSKLAYPPKSSTNLGVMVSHPHGVSKRVSIGQFQYINNMKLQPGQSVEIDKGCKCRIQASDGKQKEAANAAREEKQQCSQASCHNNPRPAEETESASSELPHMILDFDMTATPPPTAPFLWRRSCQAGFDSKWVTFPTGTEFVRMDGTDIIVPPNTQFEMHNLKNPLGPWMVTYDMASCPGSSGARVDEIGGEWSWWCHFGCGVGDGCNLSGMHFWLGR